MSLKSEKGLALIDIAVSIAVLFIFVTLIVILLYSVNSNSKEIELQAKATDIAITKIEEIKAKEFEEIKNISVANGNSNYQVLQEEENEKGFFSEIIVQDYNDIEPSAISGLVKKITVRVKYMLKGKEQLIELSTILSKGE